MNELALFAGAGGGILGSLLLGDRIVCAVERDAYAAQVLAQRQNDGVLPAFPIWSDVCSFDGKPWRGIVDCISAGFPCQDISPAGLGAGIDGERSGLWREVVRIAAEVQPSVIRLENSGMLVRRGLARVLGDLAALGFDAWWGVLGADKVGAPHKRERTWVFAAHPERVPQREESCSWAAGRVGRQFKPVAWDRNWQDALSEFRGMDYGVANRVERTDAIRNGQVPAVAAAAFATLCR